MRKQEDKRSSRSPGRPKNDLAPAGGSSEGIAEQGAQPTPGIKPRSPTKPAAARTVDAPAPEPAPDPEPNPKSAQAPVSHPRRVWPD